MIDFEIAQKSFNKYLENYNLKNESIKLKIMHTYETVKMSEYITTKLGLDKENINLSKLIALLHDIGRFEQIKNCGKFDDNKYNHANYAINALFKKKLINNFIKDRKYDYIIASAIYNHNKFKIEDSLSDIELLHCKIIRDSDKLDNFRVKKDNKLENIFPKIYNKKTINYETITLKVYHDFMKHKCIKKDDRKTIIDYWVCVIAFIYDLNFDISLKYIYENNYIDILIDKIEYKNKDTKQRMEDIRECAKNYIFEKCNIC